MRRPWLWLFILLLVNGCATFQGVGTPSKSRWFVITTTHFVVYTDLDERAAGKAATDLEATRDALMTAIAPGAKLEKMMRMRVFVLADSQEFQAVFGLNVTGLFAPGLPGAFYVHAPIELGPASAEPRSRLSSSMLRHALAHQLVAGAYPHAPPWLDEGLALFLENAHVAADGRTLVLGRTNSKAMARFAAKSNVTLGDLLEWKEPIGLLPEREGLALYGSSYVFVHWLFHERSEALAKYLSGLAGDIDPKKAWDDAFPGFDPDATAPVLADYARKELPTVHRPFVTSAPFLDRRELRGPDRHMAEAHILRGAARFAGSDAHGFEAKARSEIKKALALSPTHVEALVLDTGMETSDRLRWAHQAAGAHPEDPRAFALLGDIGTTGKEREQAYRDALRLDPTDPYVLNAMAVFLLQRDRAAEALPLVKQALRSTPYDFELLDTYSEVLERLNRCEAAVAEGRRAVHRAREADKASIRRTTKRWIDRKIACRGREDSAPVADGDAATDLERNDAPETPATPGTFAGSSQLEQKEEPNVSDQIVLEEHSGWTGGVGLGFGYLFGSFERLGSTFSGSADGSAAEIALAGGVWVIPEFAMSIEVGFLHHSFSEPPIKNVNLGSTNGFDLGRFGLLADLYPSPTSPFHFGFGLDLVRAAWNTEEGIYSSPLAATDELVGYFTHASAGFAWHALGANLGPSLRLWHGSAEGDATGVSFTGMTLVGNASF